MFNKISNFEVCPKTQLACSGIPSCRGAIAIREYSVAGKILHESQSCSKIMQESTGQLLGQSLEDGFDKQLSKAVHHYPPKGTDLELGTTAIEIIYLRKSNDSNTSANMRFL